MGIIEPPDLTILAPSFYPNMKPLWHFQQTAERFEVPVVHYGLGESHRTWLYSHLIRLRVELKNLPSTQHVLFTDTIDVIFNGTVEQMCDGYNRMGAPPILVSLEPNGLNAGGWMGEVEAALELLTLIEPNPNGDVQVMWREAVEDKTIDVIFDDRRRVFYAGEGDDLTVEKGHFKWAGSTPPIVHLPGGHTDKDTGRDYKMKPLLKRLTHAV